MRWVTIIGYIALVIGVAYWAYTESYTTRASERRVKDLNAEISKENARLNVLNAEWAYMNRPDRLETLVELNFDRLQLVPMAAQHFAQMKELPLPFELEFEEANPIEVSDQGQEEVAQ